MYLSLKFIIYIRNIIKTYIFPKYLIKIINMLWLTRLIWIIFLLIIIKLNRSYHFEVFLCMASITTYIISDKEIKIRVLLCYLLSIWFDLSQNLRLIALRLDLWKIPFCFEIFYLHYNMFLEGLPKFKMV
jgi:hypothetical protein